MASSSAGSVPLSRGLVKEREVPISVSSFYAQVVEQVIKTLRPEFQNIGLEDSVLNDVQTLWEMKLMQKGAIQAPSSSTRGVNGPVHDLNLPYEGTEEYQTPTAEMLFPPTPAAETPMQTPLPGNSDPVMYQYFPPGPAQGQATTYPDSTFHAETKIGRPIPYMQTPASLMNQKPVGLDVNVAYEEDGEQATTGINQPITKDFFNFSGGKRKREDQSSNYFSGGNYIPQQDGSADCALELCLNRDAESASKNLVHNSSAEIERRSSDAVISHILKVKYESENILQVDGTDNSHDTNVKVEEPDGSADQEDEEPLNDDDDDDLDDLDQIQGDAMTEDLVLAQFEKVSRTKNRWKCTLKDGVMHLNDKDILFSKATGEFDF